MSTIRQLANTLQSVPIWAKVRFILTREIFRLHVSYAQCIMGLPELERANK
jgi:hypothetical protein